MQATLFANFRAKTICVVLAMSLGCAPSIAGPEPVVRDAKSAIRIAWAMSRALRPDDRLVKGEPDWQSNCEARLVQGVWQITNKGHHRPHTGYFTGAAVIYISATDGRYLGATFID